MRVLDISVICFIVYGYIVTVILVYLVILLRVVIPCMLLYGGCFYISVSWYISVYPYIIVCFYIIACCYFIFFCRLPVTYATQTPNGFLQLWRLTVKGWWARIYCQRTATGPRVVVEKQNLRQKVHVYIELKGERIKTSIPKPMANNAFKTYIFSNVL